MRAYYYNILPSVGGPNFGDELNKYVWPRVFKAEEFNSAYPDGLFVGIGSIIRRTMRTGNPTIIFGAGAAYDGIPDSYEKFDIRFVRGPHTARHMGGCKSITDPAALLGEWYSRSDCPKYKVSFVPRWNSQFNEQEFEDAGIHVIRPSIGNERFIADIADSELVLAVAFHGAVTANSLGVPWISLYGKRGHEFKWHDWCASLEMVWNPIDMEEYTVKWAIDNAIPQLSSRRVLRNRVDEMLAEIEKLNQDIRREYEGSNG